jgi:hypothetical protein
VFTPRKKRLVRPSACGLETRRESAPSKPHLCRRLSCASSGRSDLGRGRTHVSWPPAPTNRLRLWASGARTARACGESVLELTFQTLGRDVLLGLNFHRDVDPDPGALEGDDLHVVGHVLPVRMVVALAFFKRTFARSLPMSQAHSLIVAEVDGACCVSTKTPFWGAGGQKDRQTLRFSRSIWISPTPPISSTVAPSISRVRETRPSTAPSDRVLPFGSAQPGGERNAT